MGVEIGQKRGVQDKSSERCLRGMSGGPRKRVVSNLASIEGKMPRGGEAVAVCRLGSDSAAA
jgi:hypothetical protein